MTTPTPYQPNKSVDLQDLPADISFGTRTSTFMGAKFLQYLVYRPGFGPHNDPELRQLLASGTSLDNALIIARKIAAMEAAPPSALWPRLHGCTFERISSESGAHIRCLDATGTELARGNDRQSVALIALHRALDGCLDMTFAEYQAISRTVCVNRGGRNTYGLTVANDSGLSAIRAMVAAAYRNNNIAKLAAAVEFQKLSPGPAGTFTEESAFEALERKCLKLMLSAGADAQLTIHQIRIEDSKWAANLILHQDRLSSADAMQFGYNAYVQDSLDQQIEQTEMSPTA